MTALSTTGSAVFLAAALLLTVGGETWAQQFAKEATAQAPARFDPRAATAPSFARENLGSDETRAQEAVRLDAGDGVAVYGDFYAAVGPSRGTFLLFHDANSNRGEYAAIAPVLVKAGYNALAIDQRAGGTRWGRANETAQFAGQKGKGNPARFADSLADLEAALDFAAKRGGRPIVAVGSGYAAALVFLLAARHPETVGAIMAFSPTNNFGDAIAPALARVRCPVFITSAAERFEVAEARRFFDAVPARDKIDIVPKHGIKGASTLRTDLNPLGAAEAWASLQSFLDGIERPTVAVKAQKRERPRETVLDASDVKRIVGAARIARSDEARQPD